MGVIRCECEEVETNLANVALTFAKVWPLPAVPRAP